MKLKSNIVLSLLVFIYILSASRSFASNCQGQTISCLDGCSGRMVTQYNADTCNFTFDINRGCNVGWGSCSGTDEDSPSACQGQTISCVDGCSGRLVTHYNADTCNFTFDINRGCNVGWGSCSR